MTADAASDAARRALAFQRNVVVAASAGTGKTHRLTALYVLLTLGLTSKGQASLADAHPPIAPDRIVATTFSRAAALEIRARVERALRAIATGDAASPFAAEIRERTIELARPPSEADIVARARAALEALHEARIETLHGLCADLLRRHAIGLGLSPSIRILEEDEAEALASGVIDEVLAEALDGSEEDREAARRLAEICGGFFRARGSLVPFFDRLDDDGLDLAALDTSDYLGAALDLRARLTDAARAACASERAPIRDAARALTAALAAEPVDPRDPRLGPEALRALGELFTQRKPTKLASSEAPLFALRDELPKSIPNAEKGAVVAATLREARMVEDRERSILTLLGRVRARLTAERREKGALGFADLLRVARDGLRDRPEVAAAARADIDALLVDEFQDTSLVQRDLVYLLRGGQEATAIEPSGLFLVGDRKQSIYGFRGADVAVFNRVCGELCGPAAATELALAPDLCAEVARADLLALNVSYRSLPAIVGFVNAFSARDFATTGAAAALAAVAYGPAEHLTAAQPAAGERVVFVEDDGAPLPDPMLAGAGPALREAFLAAASAFDLITARGLRPRDVAILARRRATIPLVELGLARLGLPYVVAGRALYDTLEVRDLAALVRLVLEPREKRALAHVLRGPLVALSEGALLALSGPRGLASDVLTAPKCPLDAADLPEEAARLESFRRRFADARPTLLRLGAPDALREAMVRFDLDRVTAALPRAPSRLANLDRLVGIARERGGSLFAFSRWLERQIVDEVDEAEAVVFSAEDDAIRICTIHGAKGLDFPATIVLDLAGREQPGFDALRFVYLPGEPRPRFVADHRSDRGARIDNPARKAANTAAQARALAERSRITYVAITRARRALYLIGSSRGGARGSMLGTFLAHEHDGLEGTFERELGAELAERALRAPRELDAASAIEPTPAAAKHIDRASSAPSTLSLAATPLSVFRGCARRFWFRFMLGLEEPIDTGQLDLFEVGTETQERKVVGFDASDEEADPRAAGRAAHRVLQTLDEARWGHPDVDEGELAHALEREGLGTAQASALSQRLAAFIRGGYARSLSTAREVHREAEISTLVGNEPSLCLRGTVDLWARFEEHAEVIDYKIGRPTPTLDAYAFQLRAYALAVARATGVSRVRAGIVFLGGVERAITPVWLAGAGGGDTLDDPDHDAFASELERLARAFTNARATDEWPGVELPLCRRERCGFVTACHRTKEVVGPPRRRRR